METFTECHPHCLDCLVLSSTLWNSFPFHLAIPKLNAFRVLSISVLYEAQISGDSCFTQSYMILGLFYAPQIKGGLDQLVPTAHTQHCCFYSTQLLSSQPSPARGNMTVDTIPFQDSLGSRFTLLGHLRAQAKPEQRGTLAAPVLITWDV